MQLNGKEVVNICKKPWWMYLIPWFSGNAGVAIYPNFYVSSRMYRSLTNPNPDLSYIAVALHELEHLKRAKTLGITPYYIGYVFNRRFRFEEEIACKQVEITYLRNHGQKLDLERAAKMLSSWAYGWCSNRAEALQRLQQLTTSRKRHRSKVK